MAVIFFCNGTSYAIGGQGGRPFPKYSVNTESISSGDGSQIGVRYSIEIIGKIIIDADAEFDDNGELVNKGVKQSRLHEIINELNSKIETDDSYGKLEIDPYNGLPNKLQYDSAKLLSINIPEQTDESRSLGYMDYTFSFEAYSNNVLPYTIQSVEESIELTENDGQFTSDGLWSSSIYKTYTITHSISAVGRKRYSENGIEIDGDAWRQAELFVRSKLVTPTNLVRGSINGGTNVDLNIQKMSGSDTGIVNLSDNNYVYYNHIRVPSCDITGGSYSITDTWIGSKHPATLDMEVNSDLDDSGITTVSLTGTIEGFNTSPSISNTIEKLTNAESIFNIVDANAFNIANQAFSTTGTCNNPLQKILTARTVGKNKNSGIITFSYSYNNKAYPSELIVDNNPITTSLSINVNYENEDNDFKVNTIAIIPLIFNNDGPEIQDMKTTPEKRRSVQIDAIMDKCYRIGKPTQYFKPLVLRHKPAAEKVYVESFTENLDEILGNYTLNITWVYK